jgi:hypothetical protein
MPRQSAASHVWAWTLGCAERLLTRVFCSKALHRETGTHVVTLSLALLPMPAVCTRRQALAESFPISAKRSAHCQGRKHIHSTVARPRSQPHTCHCPPGWLHITQDRNSGILDCAQGPHQWRGASSDAVSLHSSEAHSEKAEQWGLPVCCYVYCSWRGKGACERHSY